MDVGTLVVFTPQRLLLSISQSLRVYHEIVSWFTIVLVLMVNHDIEPVFSLIASAQAIFRPNTTGLMHPLNCLLAVCYIGNIQT